MPKMEDYFLRERLADEKPLTETGKKLFKYFEEQGKDARVTWLNQDILREFINENKPGRSREDIAADIKLVLKKRLEDQDHTERGILFEEIFGKFAEDFFYSKKIDTYITKTEDYDDRFNHIDFVIEGIGEDGQKFNIGIDTNVSDNEMRVREKVNKTYEKLEKKGRLGEIKYYYSGNDGRLVKLNYVPRIVISLSSQGLDDLAEIAWDMLEKKTRNSQELTDSKFGRVIIGQIVRELELQEDWIIKNIHDIIQNGAESKYRTTLHAVQIALENIKRLQKEKYPEIASQ